MSGLSHLTWFERDPSYAAVPKQVRAAGGMGTELIQFDQPAGCYARDGAPELSLNVIFGEAFRRTTGTTPGQYRREVLR